MFHIYPACSKYYICTQIQISLTPQDTYQFLSIGLSGRQKSQLFQVMHFHPSMNIPQRMGCACTKMPTQPTINWGVRALYHCDNHSGMYGAEIEPQFTTASTSTVPPKAVGSLPQVHVVRECQHPCAFKCHTPGLLWGESQGRGLVYLAFVYWVHLSFPRSF